MRSGARMELSRLLMISIGILNFEAILGKATFGKILILTLGSYFKAEF
jgi:hypothetical protein